MNGREKISRKERRQIILKVLRGEASQIEIVRGYGLDKSHISRLVSQAKDTPERNRDRAMLALLDAEDEVEFREEVIEILRNGESVTRRKKEE